MSSRGPELSVVIAAVNGRAYLADCLAGLQGQCGHVMAEVIVVTAGASDVASFVAREYPHVRLLSVDGAPSVPRLRAAGIQAARGEIVAITEDHCIPAPTWFESIRESHEKHAAAAIGGVVDNAATSRLVDWAVYFCEYGGYASPLPAGPNADLPGPNVSYKRSALEAVRESIADEYWETFVHGELARLGHQLWREPSIRVLHKMHFGFLSFLIERYHFGRAFAGRRNLALGWTMRVVRGTLSPLLVPLFILRIGRKTLARRRHRLRFACCLPMICCFAAAAALGEGVGYALGGGTSSLRMR